MNTGTTETESHQGTVSLSLLFAFLTNRQFLLNRPHGSSLLLPRTLKIFEKLKKCCERTPDWFQHEMS